MPKNRMFWMHAITPVHVGTGAQIGFIDLPIAREKTTDWPVVPGSGIKGVVAAGCGAADAKNRSPLHQAAFGKADDDASDQANSGALVFTDARMVCLPVRSIFGTFAWATCPTALRRLKRDLIDTGHTAPDAPTEFKDQGKTLVPDNPKSALASAKGQIFLADLDFAATADAGAGQWAAAIAAWLFPGEKNSGFEQRFVILSDDTFNYFSRTGTEITTRVRIDSTTKTVADGQLWTEEALPAEAVLAGIVWCDKIFVKKRDELGKDENGLLQEFCGKTLALQVGGKATVGRGRVRVAFSAGKE